MAKERGTFLSSVCQWLQEALVTGSLPVYAALYHSLLSSVLQLRTVTSGKGCLCQGVLVNICFLDSVPTDWALKGSLLRFCFEFGLYFSVKLCKRLGHWP